MSNTLLIGQQHNDDLGLIYYNARYYIPGIARFASADTLVPNPANPNSFNRYAYVGNNPIMGTDPDGHCWPLCTAIAGAVIGGLIGGAVQVVNNVRHDMPLTTDVGKAVTVGAVAGAVGGTTFGAGAAVLGTGFAATVVSGAVSGAVAGQASIAAGNILDNQSLTQGLGDPHDLARDAAIGGVLAGVGYGISKGFQAFSDRVSSGSIGVADTPNSIGADNAVNGIKLNRSLASQQQMGELGEPFAGVPGTKPFRDASRRANTYGGQSSDWAKMTSSTYTGVDGYRFQTHWVENVQTGLRVEFKTKLLGWKAQ